MTKPTLCRRVNFRAQCPRISSLFCSFVFTFHLFSVAMCLELSSDALSSPSYDQVPCSVFCDCLGPEFAVQADCSNRTLTVVPNDLNHATVKL
ncbi:uncharacterized protein CDAR_524581 [Caerostris darwini]|uniref:Secreted protein n=1 Tax=Caerostris darwini TaxID=1538125 RepID=A0AAV4PU12_9ARAC|nr:uncharacterized protein CDAR_524581 [Caerostris darwini]